MTTRWSIAALIYMIVSAVLFGIGAVLTLAVPAFSQHTAVLLPVVVVTSFAVAIPVSFYIAPRLRARYQSELELRRRYHQRLIDQE